MAIGPLRLASGSGGGWAIKEDTPGVAQSPLASSAFTSRINGFAPNRRLLRNRQARSSLDPTLGNFLDLDVPYRMISQLLTPKDITDDFELAAFFDNFYGPKNADGMYTFPEDNDYTPTLSVYNQYGKSVLLTAGLVLARMNIAWQRENYVVLTFDGLGYTYAPFKPWDFTVPTPPPTSALRTLKPPTGKLIGNYVGVGSYIKVGSFTGHVVSIDKGANTALVGADLTAGAASVVSAVPAGTYGTYELDAVGTQGRITMQAKGDDGSLVGDPFVFANITGNIALSSGRVLWPRLFGTGNNIPILNLYRQSSINFTSPIDDFNEEIINGAGIGSEYQVVAYFGNTDGTESYVKYTMPRVLLTNEGAIQPGDDGNPDLVTFRGQLAGIDKTNKEIKMEISKTKVG